MYVYDNISLNSDSSEEVSDESCTENRKTHFMFNNSSFQSCAVYEIMWKNIVEPDRPHVAIWRMALHDGCLRLQTHTQDM